VSLFVLYHFFKKFDYKMPKLKKEHYISLAPTIIVLLLVIALVISSFIGDTVPFTAGVWCSIFGLMAFIWYRAQVNGKYAYQSVALLLIILLIAGSYQSKAIEYYTGLPVELIWCLLVVGAFLFLLKAKKDTKIMDLLEHMDWQTGLFLVGIFIVVESLSVTGIVSDIAHGIESIAGGSVFFTFITIVGVSVMLSAFIDNIPYLVIMLPVAESLTAQLHANPFVLFFGLLIGASVGGNITPIGASANIVAMGIVRKQGYKATFFDFVKIGLPFTIAAVAASSLFIWMMFGL